MAITRRMAKLHEQATQPVNAEHAADMRAEASTSEQDVGTRAEESEFLHAVKEGYKSVPFF